MVSCMILSQVALKVSQCNTRGSHIRLNVSQSRDKLIPKQRLYVFGSNIHVGENRFAGSNFFDHRLQADQLSELTEVIRLRDGISVVAPVRL